MPLNPAIQSSHKSTRVIRTAPSMRFAERSGGYDSEVRIADDAYEIHRSGDRITGLTLAPFGRLAWIDVVLLVWFGLTALSVAYVAWDAAKTTRR